MKCVITVLLAVLASLYLGSNYYYYSPFYAKTTKASAVIHPTKGNTVSGTVMFAQEQDGVRITANLTNLNPGKHGFHIHEFGVCACDDAVCAGDHYNPTNQPHAGPQDKHRHVGDLGNISADAQGNATYEYVDTHIALNGPQSIIGRTLIIHAQEDDFKTQPSGNAGARIGCGVIGIGKK